MVRSIKIFIAFILGLMSTQVSSDHLERSECWAYHECILGEDSALNKCYDNDYLKKLGTNRVMCMRIAQHKCKVKTGISGRGKNLTLNRPGNWYERATLLEKDHQPDNGTNGDQDIRVYNYAGWNHCPPSYQGLQDFWCDPHQTRYPPRPWCDVLPNYNVQEPKKPKYTSSKTLKHKDKKEEDKEEIKEQDIKTKDAINHDKNY